MKNSINQSIHKAIADYGKIIKSDKDLNKRLNEVKNMLEEDREVTNLAFSAELNYEVDFHCSTVILLPSNYFGILRDNVLYVQVYRNDDKTSSVRVYNFDNNSEIITIEPGAIPYLDYAKEEDQLRALSNIILRSRTNIFNVEDVYNHNLGEDTFHEDVNIFDNGSYRNYLKYAGIIPAGATSETVDLYANQGKGFDKLDDTFIAVTSDTVHEGAANLSETEKQQILSAIDKELKNKVVKRDKRLVKALKDVEKRFKKDSSEFMLVVDAYVDEGLKFSCDNIVSPMSADFQKDSNPSFGYIRTNVIAKKGETKVGPNGEDLTDTIYVTRVVAYISKNFVEAGVEKITGVNASKEQKLQYISSLLLNNSVSIYIGETPITEIENIDTSVNLFSNDSYEAYCESVIPVVEEYVEQEVVEETIEDAVESQVGYDDDAAEDVENSEENEDIDPKEAKRLAKEAKKLAKEEAKAAKKAAKSGTDFEDGDLVTVEDAEGEVTAVEEEYTVETTQEVVEEVVEELDEIALLKAKLSERDFESSSYDTSNIHSGSSSASVMFRSVILDEIANAKTIPSNLDQSFVKYLSKIDELYVRNHAAFGLEVLLDGLVKTSHNIQCRSAYAPSATTDNARYEVYTRPVKSVEDVNLLFVAMTPMTPTESQVIVLAPSGAHGISDTVNQIRNMSDNEKAAFIEEEILANSRNYFKNYVHVKLQE